MRDALCAASASKCEGQAHVTAPGEAEVALLVAFAQIETVRVVRLTLVESSVISAPAWRASSLPMPVIYCRHSDRAPAASPPFLNFADPVDMMQMKLQMQADMPTTSPSSSARW